jgi:uncharacterized protein DUF6082
MSNHEQIDRNRGTWWGWTVVRTVAIVAALAAGLAVIIVSPLMFRTLARYVNELEVMANVGEAYGGVAAVLSGLALGGVVISLLLQWRQGDAARILAVRQHHLELTKLAIDQPRLLGQPPGHEADSEIAVLQINTNLWIAHWAMLWDLKHCDEAGLRNLAAFFFDAQPVARDWWRTHGSNWSTRWNRRRRRFHQIVTEEWQRAVTRSAATPSSAPKTLTRSREGLVVLVAGAVAVAAVLWARRRIVERASLDLGEEVPPGQKAE